jgi:hemolysin D
VLFRNLANAASRKSQLRAAAANDASAVEIIRQFQSETDAIREESSPRWARVTVLTLGAFLLSVVAIMCLTRLDRTITSDSGKIVSFQAVSVFQALDPSIIKSIDVREGDEVEDGQLLATLDATFAAADVKQLRLQIASLEDQIARDQALLNGSSLNFSPSPDPELRKYADMQKAYYDQQLLQYKAQVNSFDAKIAQGQATVVKLRADAARYEQRKDIAQKIEDMRAILAAHGTGSQLNLLNSQDQRLEAARSLDMDHNSLIEAEHTLASVVADREAFVQQWSTQLSQDLLTARNNLDTAQAQFDKAIKHKDLVRLTAPGRSVVLTVAKLSVGSVLKLGDTLMTLMPANSPIEAEVRIPSRSVGFLRPGDQCVLKIESFNYMEHGTADGAVRWISENAFTTDDDGKEIEPYYKARCSVDGSHFRNVPAKFRLIPGMTLEADMKVGTRSVAMYLLGGMLRGIGESMREP